MAIVRNRRCPKIGREVKVPPDAAVAVLIARGFSREIAAAAVGRMVGRRAGRIPAVATARAQPRELTVAPTRLSPSSIAAMAAEAQNLGLYE
jgi:hypothetical protein